MELSPTVYKRFVRPSWYSKLYIERLIKDRFDFDNKRILDFGSGVGSISYMFDPHGYLGVDCDLGRVEYARELNPDYNFDVLAGRDIPVEDSSMDYIVIVSVLHHIPTEDLRKYIEEFGRILKPSGSVVAIEPCIFKNCYFCNFIMNKFDKGKYIRDEEGYLDLFKNSDFKVMIHQRFNQMFLYNKLFFTASRH
ncbi:MAG: class I SAM-dependent methyltransferase [Bacillota bacterium]